MHDLEGVGIHTGLPPGAGEGPRYVGQPEVDFSFDDFLDVINPLQHIPGVANLYREITGDEISPHARILGDTLFGGPTGFVASIANVFYEEVAGEDIGQTVMAFFSGDDAQADPQVAGDADDAATAAVFPADAWTDIVPPAPLETAAGPDPAMPNGTQGVPSHGNPPETATPAASAAHTEAILPEAGDGMLTGQDALNALFMDLGGGQPAMPLDNDEPTAMPLPARQGDGPGTFYPLAQRHVRIAPAAAPATAQGNGDGAEATGTGSDDRPHPLLFAQEAGESGEGGIADRMMQALDKYEAMSRQRHRASDEAAEPQWETDPVLAPEAGT